MRIVTWLVVVTLLPETKPSRQLRKIAERPDIPIEERAIAGFAIGKALDDAGQFDQAFAAYEQANLLYRDARANIGDRFIPSRLQLEVDETIAKFDANWFSSVTGLGNPSALPVFVLGMPRSGTTLVEQIAATHSQVYGAGELRDIGTLAAQFVPERSPPDMRQIADNHLARLRELGGTAERVIDKMPDNVFKLGTIATLFPGARIVFCCRDPRDVCLSCYFQKFAPGQLTFSYDLADCAQRYRETARLVEHWRRVLPLRMIDIQYETLVIDPEKQIRRLLEFLGLGWEPNCLNFSKTKRVVTTASSWQVRQPLYNHSIGRWQNYAKHLDPLMRNLGTTS